MPRKPREESSTAVDTAGISSRLRPTQMNHIYHFDILGDGRYREVAVVKLAKDKSGTVRSIYYVDVGLLDSWDKGRIKGIITGVHADKYELWDLMSQTTLNNGKNALDYFHQLTRVEHGKGAVSSGFGAGLGSVQVESNQIIGSEFSDPTSASLDTQAI